MTKGVLAIFVKTPELSPVKTRLAEGIGKTEAFQFYNQALDVTAALACHVRSELQGQLDVVWTVAELQGMDSNRWREFGTVFQGEGGLGERLHTVYDKLINQYDYVTFMGADSPHISVSEIVNGIKLTKKWRNEKFIIGETFDGGFYFFGGGKPLVKDVWTHVEYSSSHTAQQLEIALETYGGIEKIEKSFDIDTVEDLLRLHECKNNLLPEQKNFIEWTRTLKLSGSTV
ncbi:MAG: hypothetical protein A4S09_14975 [Proteobacteria bacterium SG_bin7]|nr:MAG: hypothetical protein A4S09_14975 [Proteobacteria bacterium SG_bin7]